MIIFCLYRYIFRGLWVSFLTLNSVPHVTNAIQDWIERVAKFPVDESGAEPDVCIIELGEYDQS